MKHISLFALLISLPVVLPAQNYAWTQKANYGGGAIYDPSAFVIGTRAYVGCGRDLSGNNHVDFWEYDTATDTWTQLANFSGPARFAGRGFSINNLGYFVSGGMAGNGVLKDLWQYNPTTNTWLQRTPHPGPARYIGIAFTAINKGYFGLGSDFGANYQNDLQRYDPITNTWAQQASFPGAPRQAASAFVINDDAYVGFGSDILTDTSFSDFYKYNAPTNTWTPAATFPGQPRAAVYAFAINGKGYVVCGTTYTGQPNQTLFNDFWEYNPISDTWLQLPSFPGKARMEGISFSIGNNGYIGLGADTLSFTNYLSDLWVYAPTTSISEDFDDIELNLGPNPAGHTLEVSWDGQSGTSAELTIYGLNGAILLKTSCDRSEADLEIRGLAKSVYILEVRTREGIARKKFVKQ